MKLEKRSCRFRIQIAPAIYKKKDVIGAQAAATAQSHLSIFCGNKQALARSICAIAAVSNLKVNATKQTFNQGIPGIAIQLNSSWSIDNGHYAVVQVAINPSRETPMGNPTIEGLS